MQAPKINTKARKEQITKAAMELISTVGLSSFNITSVASRVGIVPSGVYRHYKNKEAILDAVLDLLRSQMLTNTEIVCIKTTDSLLRLKLLLDLHITMLLENPAFPHVIFAYLSQDNHFEHWAKLKNTICCYIKEIEKIIIDGQQNNDILANISPQIVAIMFIGLVLPAAILHRLSNGEFDPSEHIKKAWPIFVQGLIITTQTKGKR